ncbi:MAG: endonuclease/exonuclease/phosphatase family protein [Acidobacteria bacterium]|nr:endonuclease/exonuclease/phosphatase family protein [Acidobacteriota bacterium]
MQTWLQLASAVLALASLMPMVRLPFWWVRIFDFPRAQLMALGAGVLATDLIALDLQEPSSMLAVGALTLGEALEVSRILPYTALGRIELVEAETSLPKQQLSLLTCNVYQHNRDSERLLNRIAQRSPDIVFLLEVDDWWVDSMSEIEREYPHRLLRPQDDTYGMALYSRFELVDPEIRFVRRDHIPSVKTDLRLPSGQRVRLYGLHPAPPAPQYAETTSQRDAELILVGREAKVYDKPVVVVGDLNDVAWSHTTRLFRRISGLLDPRVGRRTMSTFPVAAPLLRFPLDHIFVSNHFKLVDFDRLEDVGSDHFPVWAKLQLEASAELEQPEPQPEGNDLEEAHEIVGEANQEIQDERASSGEPSDAVTPSSASTALGVELDLGSRRAAP